MPLFCLIQKNYFLFLGACTLPCKRKNSNFQNPFSRLLCVIPPNNEQDLNASKNELLDYSFAMKMHRKYFCNFQGF